MLIEMKGNKNACRIFEEMEPSLKMVIWNTKKASGK
jgi:hypothetical protein